MNFSHTKIWIWYYHNCSVFSHFTGNCLFYWWLINLLLLIFFSPVGGSSSLVSSTIGNSQIIKYHFWFWFNFIFTFCYVIISTVYSNCLEFSHVLCLLFIFMYPVTSLALWQKEIGSWCINLPKLCFSRTGTSKPTH